MSKVDRKNKSSGTSTVPIIVASIASIVWVSLAVFLGMNASPDHRIWPLGNLSANEWGDFLAGVAGTLAFIWLIATVLIQAKELRLQRAEMEDNREVATEQARYIGEQTKLLQQESKERRNVHALKRVNAASERIENMINWRHFSGLELLFSVDAQSYKLFSETGIPTFVHRMRSAIENLRKYPLAKIRLGPAFSFSHFGELNVELDEWQRLSKNLDASFLPLRKNETEIKMLLAIVKVVLSADTDMVKELPEKFET